MTSKAQTMLTIALTAAVGVLIVDRMIEPAQAQSCAPMWQVVDLDTKVTDLKTVVDINQAMTRQILAEVIAHRMKE